MENKDLDYDFEIVMYEILDKFQKENLQDEFHKLVNESIILFVKRFGGKDYVKTENQETIISELIDCINHLSVNYDWFKKMNKEHREVMITMIYSWMIG